MLTQLCCTAHWLSFYYRKLIEIMMYDAHVLKYGSLYTVILIEM
jgi:hypothetical protein